MRGLAIVASLLAACVISCSGSHAGLPDSAEAAHDAAVDDDSYAAWDAGPPDSWPVLGAAPASSPPPAAPSEDGESRTASPEDGRVAAERCNGVDDDGDGKRDEGCPHLLGHGRLPMLKGGRVIWLQPGEGSEQELWTAALPGGEPERVAAGYPMRADVDGDRVVYSDYEEFGYAIVDLRQGTRVLVEPHDPEGTNLLYPSLDGRYLAYSQDLPISCSGWCDETEVYLHDLETGASHNVARHKRTIQTAPRISGSYMVWADDRHGHHKDTYGGEHWFDVMGTALPYEGTYDRLSEVQPRSAWVLDFVGGRVLATELTDGLESAQLLDVESGELLSLEWAAPLGDRPLDLSQEYVLVLHDPLGDCQLRLGRFRDQALLDVSTDGACPEAAQVDGDFVLFTHAPGVEKDFYYVDIGDLGESIDLAAP